MKVFYFTGTGNSLAVARELCEAIPGSELVPIASIMKKGERITITDSEKVGLVYPMYCGGLPDIVARFVSESDFSGSSYVFTVVTIGGAASGNPVKLTRKAIEKSNHGLDASWCVNMPDNYIPMKSAIPAEKQKELFSAASAKIREIASMVQSATQYHDKERFVGKMMGLAHNSFLEDLKDSDKKFWVDGNCERCGTCANVCPVDNISMAENGPVWNHNCEGCLACLQFCPRHAISYGKKTAGKERYHHPGISAKDMEDQKNLR